MSHSIAQAIALHNANMRNGAFNGCFAALNAAIDAGDSAAFTTHINALVASFTNLDAFILREDYIRLYGFAVPGSTFVDTARPYGPILEVAAGAGTLGRLLRNAGVDCVSTDASPWANAQDVQAMDGAHALDAFPGRSVLCAWPDYESSWLNDLLPRFRTGQHLLLVGEGCGGCTGDEALWDALKGWTRKSVPHSAIWSWPGTHDFLSVWEAP